jgi:acetyl esterase/lipase
VLYLHGGGMILGSVAIFDGPVSRYVAHTGVAMPSIEFRLAPEHPHPTPVEDAYAGLVWLAAHAEELGVDRNRIAVIGDSAGGGLAAGVSILNRDRGGPALARQILLYPMLDDRNTNVDPHIAPFAGWSYDHNITGWNALLGERGDDTHV